jgi:fatty acid desaturase
VSKRVTPSWTDPDEHFDAHDDQKENEHPQCGPWFHFAFTLPLVSTHIAEEIAFPQADEGGYVDGCWETHQLATSMDYSPDSRLANWLLGAVNAHAAHHLFPEVCHVHYVALSKIIRGSPRITACLIMRCPSRRPSVRTSGT